MSEHDSLADTLRAVPRLWKVLIGIGVVLASVGTTGAAFAIYRESLATDAEVDAAIEKHNRRGRDADNTEESPHPPYARAAKAFEAFKLHVEEERKAERRRDAKILEYLVSIQAADGEPNRRRKADAAAFARTAFKAAVKAGTEPEDAAEQALDSPPPWRQ